MLIRHPLRRTPTRRGAILIVVLAMLALFAVIGLSFVLYAESEATSMRNAGAAVNQSADPDPQEASNDFLRQLIFDTDSDLSAVRGHSFAQTKYGWTSAGWSQSPYAGGPIPPEDLSAFAGTPLDRRSVVNFSARNAGNASVDPKNSSTLGALNRAVPYTYPDRSNYFLAMQRPDTGEIVQPSFYRADLFGPLDPTNGGAGSNNWTNDAGKYLTTRPRPRENPNFPPVPANADGSFTGDVQNMKFISGGTQKNDSLWMYAGAPVKTWRGKQYTSCVAPLVLDLSGRVNLSVAGNNRNGGQTASNQGFGPWEVNPTQVGIDPTEFRSVVAQRYSGSSIVPPDPVPPANRYTGSTGGTINRGSVPPQYARIDADAVGTGAADPMSVPGGGNYNPFLVFTARFAQDQNGTNTELANHPQTFNPFHWLRGDQKPAVVPHAFGMDDLVRLGSRYSDPKNRYLQTELGTIAPNSFTGNAPAAQQNRALTTPFSVAQSWAEVSIATGGGAFAKLGPVDLNRPLPDYRSTPGNPFAVGNATAATIQTANSARQRLAMDIFLRLAALAGLVDGTTVVYNTSFHCLTGLVTGNANYDLFRRLAQYAANVVDAIDNDDVSTAFVWNPAAPAAGADYSDTVTQVGAAIGDRMVFGTELPRIVVNEAYCKLDNERSAIRNESVDEGGKPNLNLATMTRPAKGNVYKKYWVELHNPLPPEPAGSLQSDLGAARLQTAAGPNTNIYQVVIADYDATKPLSSPNNVTGDPGAAGANMNIRLTINDFTRDGSVPAAEQILAGDEQYLVHQASGAALPATNGGNAGYFVLGPLDKFPPKPQAMIHSSSLPDPGAAPTVNTLISDAGLPSNANILAAKAISSTVILRRLANPYSPAQTDPTMANFNPFITVDTVDNIPTRDRAEYDDQDKRNVANVPDNGPTIGRKHPYASAPIYGAAANATVIDQVDPAAAKTPAHRFFDSNTNYNNTAFVHFDRELINSSELLHVSFQPPHLLTANFSDGTNFNLHTRATAANGSALLDPNYPAAGSTLFRAFDLLTTANRLPGIPVGGREPGRVNINTAMDSAILRAVLDPQDGNSFGAGIATDAWNTVTQTRSPTTGIAFSATTDEGGTNRPFKSSWGTPDLQATVFRQSSTVPGSPMFFNPGVGHPYMQAEPHRKGSGNLTTVSDGFLVIWTVGFFEVDAIDAGVPQLGKGLFDKVPGDLRAQYSAVVDRSAIQVPQAQAPATNGAKPWETKLMADAPIGSTTITVEGGFSITSMTVYTDGQAISVSAGSPPIRLGYGDKAVTGGDGEWVKIQSVAAGPTAGTVTITLDTTSDPVNYPGIQRFHGGSTRVSNTLPGNPGPQPGFDPSAPANRHIVPYFTRMEP